MLSLCRKNGVGIGEKAEWFYDSKKIVKIHNHAGANDMSSNKPSKTFMVILLFVCVEWVQLKLMQILPIQS